MPYLGNLWRGVAYVGILLAFLILVPRLAGPANYDIEGDTGTLDVQGTSIDAEKAREKQECEKGPQTLVTTSESGDRVVEGDIVVGKGGATYAPVINVPSQIWPDGVVPYEIDSVSPPTDDQKRLIEYAMMAWQQTGVVHFTPKKAYDTHFITFKNKGDVCQSPVGMQRVGQEVSIGPHCDHHNILHEIGHVLGLFHEHSRNDHNLHIKILWDNIKKDDNVQFCAVMFKRLGSGEDFSNRYDFASVMHYRLDAFSKCPQGGGLTPQCRTIEVKNPEELRAAGLTESQVGRMSLLSAQDVDAIRWIYARQRPPPPPETGRTTSVEGSSGQSTVNNPRGSIIITNPRGPIEIYRPKGAGRIWSPARRRPPVWKRDCCYPRMSWCRWWRAPVPHYFGYWEEFDEP